jgi:Ca2+-transporting ATPase
MVVYEMVRLVGIRSDYKIKWFSNPWLSVAIGASLLLQLAVLYFTPLADVFQVGPIQAFDWAVIAVGSVFLFTAMKLIDPLLDKIYSQSKPQYDSSHYEHA